jgi:hypothetical protein
MRFTFKKELLAHVTEREPAELGPWEQRCRKIYWCAEQQQKKGDTTEFKKLPKDMQQLVLRLSLLPLTELMRYQRETISYFTKARAIHKKADKQARQIWRRVMERNRGRRHETKG